MFELDVRGLSCPIPVVRTQKAIEEHPKEELMVMVDTAVSRENVSRLAHSKGYEVSIEAAGSDFRLRLTPSG